MTPVSRIPSAVGAAPRTIGLLLSLFYFQLSNRPLAWRAPPLRPPETPTLFGSGIRRVKWGAAHAAGIDNGGDRRTEFAGGEGVEGAEAVGEFGGGQAALAGEAAEKNLSAAVFFQRVALETTRDEGAGCISNCITPKKPFSIDIF